MHMQEKADTRSAATIIDEALETGGQYLEEALPEIRELAEEFYRRPNAGTWQKFGQMAEGLDWLMHMLHSVAANSGLYFNAESYQETCAKLSELLGELSGAVEGGDTVLTGDLILYEFVPVLEFLRDTIKESLAGKHGAASFH